MAEVVVKKGGVEDVEFFGAVDRNKDGKISSQVPSWYLKQHKEELEEQINYSQNQLDREMVPQEEKPLAKSRLAEMKKKLSSINESEPRLNGNQKDELAKVSESLGEKIRDAMFTRSDMMRGVADAHEEARRMADPCIKLSGNELQLAHKAGCRISRDGQVSRTDAERVWKLTQRAIGAQHSNTESLRRQQ